MQWLMKTEPEVYGLADLEAAKVGRWDGVRNYSARNHLRECKEGDEVLIYHTGKQPMVVGLAEVAREAYTDPAQFDPTSPYYDAKSIQESPRWVCVDLRFKAWFEQPVGLDTLKSDARLSGLAILKQSRLSVSPVNDEEFRVIVDLATP